MNKSYDEWQKEVMGRAAINTNMQAEWDKLFGPKPIRKHIEPVQSYTIESYTMPEMCELAIADFCRKKGITREEYDQQYDDDLISYDSEGYLEINLK